MELKLKRNKITHPPKTKQYFVSLFLSIFFFRFHSFLFSSNKRTETGLELNSLANKLAHPQLTDCVMKRMQNLIIIKKRCTSYIGICVLNTGQEQSFVKKR